MRALLPAGFALGALWCALALLHAPAAVAVDRAQPLTVVTYWQQFGTTMCGGLFVALLLSSAGYLALLRKLPLSASAWCAFACAAGLLFPVVFSSDVYAYAGYGAMIAHGIDPYAHARIAVRDPLLDAMQWQWGNPPPMCVYGPLFLLLARIAAALASWGTAAPLWFLRICSCAALVACVPLANAALWWLPSRERVRAGTVLALNPATVWACVEGHNDVFAIALIFAGLALMRRHALPGAALLALSSAVKAPALLAAGVLPFAFWFDRDRRMKALAGAVLGSAAALALCFPLIAGLLHNVAPGGRYAPHFSPQFLFANLMPVPAALALTLICALAIARAGRGRAAYTFFALWMCIPNPYPWYGIWLLTVAALCCSRREQVALVAACLLGTLRYFGEATGALQPALESAIALVAFGIPAALLFSARNARARFVPPGNQRRDLDFAPVRPA